jgi:hypothetical protein
VSDWIVRSRADTTPIDSDWRSPKGLPIAATGSPTLSDAETPSLSGVSERPCGSTLISATSAFGSCPTTWAGTRLPSENSTYTWSAATVELPRSVVTTCAFVAM